MFLSHQVTGLAGVEEVWRRCGGGGEEVQPLTALSTLEMLTPSEQRSISTELCSVGPGGACSALSPPSASVCEQGAGSMRAGGLRASSSEEAAAEQLSCDAASAPPPSAARITKGTAAQQDFSELL